MNPFEVELTSEQVTEDDCDDFLGKTEREAGEVLQGDGETKEQG